MRALVEGQPRIFHWLDNEAVGASRRVHVVLRQQFRRSLSAAPASTVVHNVQPTSSPPLSLEAPLAMVTARPFVLRVRDVGVGPDAGVTVTITPANSDSDGVPSSSKSSSVPPAGQSMTCTVADLRRGAVWPVTSHHVPAGA